MESLEVTVAVLGQKVESIDNSMRAMADAYSKLADNNVRVSLLELDMVNEKESTKKLWEHIEKIDNKTQSAGWKIAMESLKFIGAILLGVIGYKAGK